MKARHVRVTGRVQGVWFRAWTKERAEALGVAGWVRNRPDGTVEAVVSGPDAAVEELIEALHRGSPGAEVASVHVSDAEAPPGPGFHIKG